MSKHIAPCSACHRHYNTKFNRFCPRCGGRPKFVGVEGPVTEQDVEKLKEHFGHGT